MRIRTVTDGDGPLWARTLIRMMSRCKGKVSPPLRVYGWKPGILLMFLGLGKVVRAPGELPERLKRLAMYWTARRIECTF